MISRNENQEYLKLQCGNVKRVIITQIWECLLSTWPAAPVRSLMTMEEISTDVQHKEGEIHT